MRTKTFNEEVLYPDECVVRVSADDVDQWKTIAQSNARRRIRLCAHPDATSLLHEMIIVHERGTYVPPHKHFNRSESIHIIEGQADAILFDDNGSIRDVIAMGPYGSNRVFFYRISEPVFHTLLIHSRVLVFHETTQGPLQRDSTVFAAWAPRKEDLKGVRRFMKKLSDITASSSEARHG